MPMYTRSELREHFDKVDSVWIDFSNMYDNESRRGFIVVFYYVGSDVVFRYRIRNVQFKAFVLYQVCQQRHLMKTETSAYYHRRLKFDSSMSFFFFLVRMIG